MVARRGKRYCSNLCARAFHPHASLLSPIEYGECARCGGVFVRRLHRLGTYCSPRCSKRARKHARRHIHRSTARRGEVITIRKLAERDHWRCGICGKAVPKNRTVPHPRAATVDHVIPLDPDHRGTHTWDNVQLAHFECNWRKSSGYVAHGEQLRLLG